MDNRAIKAITRAAKHHLTEIRRLANYEPTMYDVELIHNHSKGVERFVDLLNREWGRVIKKEGE